MGFDLATIQFLAKSGNRGVSFDRVLTLGRQWIYAKPDDVRSLLARNGIQLSMEETTALFAENGYCEPLFRLLGARSIDSMDVSTYENATVIQDLNHSWPGTLRERFSLVVDGGTLEHVFNFPLAIRNCMDAIAPGGHFLSITPANNLMGHGFYQFSPELFFRIFSAENGFEVEKIIVYEQPWKSVWYEVSNPAEIRSRVELVNTRPVYMIACAKKIRSVDVFSKPPVQSDYPLIYWQNDGGPGATGPASLSPIKRHTPEWIASCYRKLRPFRPRYFRKVRF